MSASGKATVWGASPVVSDTSGALDTDQRPEQTTAYYCRWNH